MSDADVFIDRRHMGSGFDIVEVDTLDSALIDMDNFSRAIVFATEKGSGLDGYPVNFAGAWGRNDVVSSCNVGEQQKLTSPVDHL